VLNKQTKDRKDVSKMCIVEFTRKYKELFVKGYSTLPDLPHAAAKAVFNHIIKMEVNLTE
jgi:hypothetical protein